MKNRNNKSDIFLVHVQGVPNLIFKGLGNAKKKAHGWNSAQNERVVIFSTKVNGQGQIVPGKVVEEYEPSDPESGGSGK